MIKEKLYSIVIPVYNSEGIVEKTVKHTISTLEAQNIHFEIILVDDRSKDDSWKIIEKLAQHYKNVVAIALLKNYGQHSAILCGIKQSQGDYIITMDDDLQNPPEEIIKLITKINEGYDLVFAKFIKKQHNITRRLGSKLINYFNKKIFDKPKGIVLSNFRIFTKDVAYRMQNYKTNFPYIPGLLLMFSNKIANIETLHQKREVGKSNYNMWVILKLLSRLLFNYSSYPLKLLTQIGIIISVLSFIIGMGYLINGLINGSNVKGWTTLVVLLSFFNGFTIAMLGIMGEYLSRVLSQLSISESYSIRKIVKNES